MVESSPTDAFPTSRVAFALLCGFTFMYLVEQLIQGHSHEYQPASTSENDISLQIRTSHAPLSHGEEDEIDAAIRDLESNSSHSHPLLVDGTGSSGERKVGAGKTRALPLTLGLCIHGLADGLALGAAATASSSSATSPDASSSTESMTSLSLVVFIALAIHKGTFL